MGSMIDKLLSRLTQDPREQHNVKRLGVNMMLQNADLPLYTGTELQAFQVKVGLSTSQMGLIGIPGTIVSIIAMLWSTGMGDKIRRRVHIASLVIAGMSLLPLTMLIMCLGPASFRRPDVVQVIMMTVAVINAAFYSFYSVLWATIFSRAIRNEIRGRFMGIVGVVGGLIGMGVGLLSALALKYYGYPHGFTIAFLVSVLLIFLSAIVIRGTRELPELQARELPPRVSPWTNLRQVVGMRQFRILMPANVLRGLGDGAGTFAMAVGMSRMGLSLEYAGYTTALTYFAGLLATAMIGVTVDRFGAGKVIPIIEVFLVIGLMGMVMVSMPVLFLLFFLLWQIMVTMEGLAIPLVHFEIVPVEVIGAFSGVRLLILTVVGGLSGLAVGYGLELVSPLLIYALCAGLKLTAGILYWYGVKVVRNGIVPTAP